MALVKKNGELIGVSIDVKEGIECKVYMRFTNGIFEREILDTEDPKSVLASLVEENDLAITNARVVFSYCDYNKKIAFKTAMFDMGDKNRVLPSVEKIMDEKAYQMVSSMFEGVKPNVNVVNIGFTFDGSMNSLSITGTYVADENIKEIDTRQYKNTLDYGTPFDLKMEDFIDFVKKTTEVNSDIGTIILYSGDWDNEDWNGPNGGGGFVRIGEDNKDTGYMDYDYDVESIRKTNDDADSEWDQNALVLLSGHMDTELIFLLNNAGFIQKWAAEDYDDFPSGCVMYDLDELAKLTISQHNADSKLANLREVLDRLEDLD